MPSRSASSRDRLRLALAVGERPGRPAGVARRRRSPSASRRRRRRSARSREQLGHLLRGGRADEDRRARRPGARRRSSSICGYRRGSTPASTSGASRWRSRTRTPSSISPIALAQRVGARVGRAAQAEQDVLVRVAQRAPAGEHARLGTPRGRTRTPTSPPSACGRGRRRRPRAARRRGASRRPAELGREPASVTDASTSTITASPWPPPEQIAAQP